MKTMAVVIGLLAGISIVGCGAAEPNTSSGSSGVAPSGTETSNAAGKCTGTAVDPSKMLDISSCFAQDGDWQQDTRVCTWRGSFGPETFCASKLKHTPGFTAEQRNEQCTQILGCVWEGSDGTKASNPDLNGDCSGTPLPCKGLPQANCHEVYGCKWTSPADVCGNLDPYTNERPPCSKFSVGTNVEAMSAHPSVVHFRCLQMAGCKFTRTDGTVFTSNK